MLLLAAEAGARAQSPLREVRGTAVDGSGGVLPGVTVVATSSDGRVLATTVTGQTGEFALEALPRGSVDLTFRLEGFADAAVRVPASPGTGSPIVAHMELAGRTETVVVHPPAALEPLTRPAPTIVPVAAHDRDSVCGPSKAAAVHQSLGTIRSRRYEADHRLYVTGDELVIDAGTRAGLEPGLNLVARRYFRVKTSLGAVATGEHTSGLLQITDAEEQSSTAVVVYACDEIAQGDFLAAFAPEPVRAPDPAGLPPRYGEAARILFADAGQMLGVPRRQMVIDRGSSHGLQAGQRVTLFRRAGRGAEPSIVGEAVIVATQAESATIRVDRATDAILFGDWAAPQGSSPGVLPVAATSFPQP